MILHIAVRSDWQAAQGVGDYRPASLTSEGFIHCSTADQLAAVANAFFRDRRDLLILVIDESRLTSPLKWEPAVGDAPVGGLFPHIHGRLNLEAVIRSVELHPGPDGTFSLPSLL